MTNNLQKNKIIKLIKKNTSRRKSNLNSEKIENTLTKKSVEKLDVPLIKRIH